MKFLLSIALLCTVSTAKSQLLSGAIVDAGRKMTSNTDFKIASNYEGYVVYEVAVDPNGVVTSTQFVPERSNIKSTPANMEAKNYLKTLTFEPGDYYPKHHHVLVKVTYIKQKAPAPTPGKNN